MKKIDMSSWTRKEIYDHFSMLDYPFYCITMPIDVTKVKKISKINHLSFYHLMIWLCTNAINTVEEFNYRIYDNELYCIENSKASYTDIKKGSEHFQFITINYQEDYIVFLQDAKDTLESQIGLYGDKEQDNDVIYFSSLPWFDFTALTNERNFDKDDMIPRISWGKYYQEGESLKLHLSIEVNHRTIDGSHIAKFKDELDQLIHQLTE